MAKVLEKNVHLAKDGKKSKPGVGDKDKELKYEIDPNCKQSIADIETFRLGQTLEVVTTSALILAGIKKPSMLVHAVTVRFVFMDLCMKSPEELKDLT